MVWLLLLELLLVVEILEELLEVVDVVVSVQEVVLKVLLLVVLLVLDVLVLLCVKEVCVVVEVVAWKRGSAVARRRSAKPLQLLMEMLTDSGGR